jgi:hypothetical protein
VVSVEVDEVKSEEKLWVSHLMVDDIQISRFFARSLWTLFNPKSVKVTAADSRVDLYPAVFVFYAVSVTKMTALE